MTSWHELGARKAFLDSLEIHGRSATYDLVELGRQSQWCHDSNCFHALEAGIIGQTHTGDEPLEQLFCRGQLEQLVEIGQLRRKAVPVRAGPERDRERVLNQQSLDAALAGTVFTAAVAGGPGETDDGSVAWHSPVTVVSMDEAVEGRTGDAVIAAGSAPLEIGYTMPSRTLMHLYLNGAVWRWPYRTRLLWLLVSVQHGDEGWRVLPRSHLRDTGA